MHDPTDPIGKLSFNALAMVAEFEADLIRLRTREGMKVARTKGRLRGKRPKLTAKQAEHLVVLHEAGEHTTSELGARRPSSLARDARTAARRWCRRRWRRRSSGCVRSCPSRASTPARAPSTRHLTIWRILTRRGFVTPQPQKRPKSSWQRFTAAQPNERWQADITHWQLADRTEVQILNIEDDHSRLDLLSQAARSFTATTVLTGFRTAFKRYGIPARVLTDNGAVFTGKPRRGQVAVENELIALRVKFDHSRPYHTQTCGKVERFHQTQKKWLAAQPAAPDLQQLQQQLNRFRRYYNTTRPHRALDRQTPAEVYAARPKALPDGPNMDPRYRVRTDKVDSGGTITLRHNSRLHHIGLGRRLAGTRVYVLAADLHTRVIAIETGELLRELTLDPTRDYQRTGRPPGPPPKRP